MFKKLICFFGERFESDIIRTAKNKQKSQGLFSAMTNKQQPFPGGPLLGIQQNKGNRGGGVGACQDGAIQQSLTAYMETRTTTTPNKYQPQFQGYRGKTLSFKNSTTKQNVLEL